jgi:acetyl esterase
MKKALTLTALAAALACNMAAAQDAATPPKAEASMQKVLDALKSLNGKPIETLSPEQARLQPTPTDAVKKLLVEMKKSTAPEPGVTVKDLSMPVAAGGTIPLHVYIPDGAGAGPLPVMMYYHGGGFVIADTKVYDASPRALAKMAKAIIVAVDYRRAPEHKFPAAPDDAFAAYNYTLAHAKEWGGDPTRVAVGGESAGGNLATVVSLMARDKKVQMPVHQLLVYPVVDNDMNRPSYQQNANAKPLNKPMMAWFFKHYGADAKSPYALPLKNASLKGLPPATVIAAEIDPLRDEGKAYADKLQQAGVKVDYKLYDGVTHEFFGMGAVVPKAKDAEQYAADALKKAFDAKH